MRTIRELRELGIIRLTIRTGDEGDYILNVIPCSSLLCLRSFSRPVHTTANPIDCSQL
jgi:hypothetical protein